LIVFPGRRLQGRQRAGSYLSWWEEAALFARFAPHRIALALGLYRSTGGCSDS